MGSVYVGEFLYDAGGGVVLARRMGETRGRRFRQRRGNDYWRRCVSIPVLIGKVDAQEIVSSGDFVHQDVVDESAG